MPSIALVLQINQIFHQKIIFYVSGNKCTLFHSNLSVNIHFHNKFRYFPGDNEQRAIIQPQSLNDPLVKELIGLLIDWINDELADERIIVKNIEEDVYDGQVLHKLWEKLTSRKLDVPEVTQSEEGQRQKLQIVLNAVNHVRFMGFYFQHTSSL